MENKVFGDVQFDYGWKTNLEFEFLGTVFFLVVNAKSYFEDEGITENQENAYTYFLQNRVEIQKKIENILLNSVSLQSKNRFTPNCLLIERDGKMGILFDDKADLDNGIVVTIIPELKILTQDEYL
ncbi:MAG: DUF6985 domain-containing protein [Lactococcus lactis]|uniref:DUF6985 domain-containing protein n=1 Tax=Lactococcus lactis TaxID=1358 RepID=UPI0021A6DAEC|nr:hypothetical protein [Lactococcus lactis]MCT3101297.1 hypothetical protein [Lactococcus lactis]